MVAGPFDERTLAGYGRGHGRHRNIAKSQEAAQEEKSKVYIAAIR
jgi:hypothetical protein